jgi:voltage-gated potassium channel
MALAGPSTTGLNGQAPVLFKTETMGSFFKKLLIGNPDPEENKPNEVLQKRISNVKAIWNNTHHNDSGIEKILRLFLAISQFVFPGIYLKELFKKYGGLVQEVVTELFILLKTAFPLFLLMGGYYHNAILFVLMIWFMMETFLYIPTLIFASDTFSSPRSYRRSMILLFLNYIEIVFAFAVLYARGDYLNKAFEHWYDPVYFSFITSSSIGYGDYFPVKFFGKFLVCLQSMFFLSFIILFINFFSHRVKSKGYFEK